MARILTNNELKAIMKALMVVWQENNPDDQLGLNMGNDLLCKMEITNKMDTLLTNEDNYEFQSHVSEWFDENVAELLEAYHQRKAEQEAREQHAKEMADKLKVTDCGGDILKFEVDDEQEQE